jgi:hypothetical protein
MEIGNLDNCHEIQWTILNEINWVDEDNSHLTILKT